MASSNKPQPQEDSDDDYDVFTEERNKVVKTYSKEQVVSLLFKKRHDEDLSIVKGDDLALLQGDAKEESTSKPEKSNEKKSRKEVSSFPSGSLFATAAFAVPSSSRTRHAHLVGTGNSLVEKLASTAQHGHENGKTLFGVTVESIKTEMVVNPKKMAFGNMILSVNSLSQQPSTNQVLSPNQNNGVDNGEN